MATVVLGGQFGDEGKGKLVDLLSSSYGLCARAAGGDNAGHTVVAAGQSYDFHLIPSSLLTPSTMNVIGSGCVVHVPSFFKELEQLERKGLETRERLFISDRAHVVFDLHQLVDGLEEAELGKGGGNHAVGTTKRGIGPCYSQKAARSGVRISEVFNKQTMDRKLRATAAGMRKRYGDLLGEYDVETEIVRFDREFRERLRPFVIDQIPLIQSAPSLLVEGANALLLDVDYGTYPMCTSSNTGIGGVFTGLAISPFKIKDIIGVVKAYMTRVGNGPFPTEQADNAVGERLQSVGHEYGVTTGRKRRCGWLDLVAVRHSAAVNHYTALNLTKLDILDDFDTIQIATAYRVNGDELPSFPADLDTLASVDVVYETLPGWQQATTGVKSFEQLPSQARRYVEFIEDFIGVKVKWIGTGPGRESMITR